MILGPAGPVSDGLKLDGLPVNHRAALICSVPQQTPAFKRAQRDTDTLVGGQDQGRGVRGRPCREQKSLQPLLSSSLLLLTGDHAEGSSLLEAPKGQENLESNRKLSGTRPVKDEKLWRRPGHC